MAQYTGNFAYRLTPQGGQYLVGARQGTPTTFTGPDGEWEPGSTVVTFVSDGWPIDEIFAGFTDDGIVTLSQNNNTLYLTTDNADYAGKVISYTVAPYPVCFVKGTLIETARGAVPVESLTVGDTVLGSTGLRTVKWIGWRHYDAVALRPREERRACQPIRILAGALAPDLPSSDLRVSPWHHIFVDGVLVRAKDLVNERSIFQESSASKFSYYHVELDTFDVIQAHGVFSESWADGGNRDFFQNVDVTSLRPEDKVRRRADRPGFKVLRKPADIAPIHARIAQRAEEHFATQAAA
ncbi:hypothetical protein GOQ28_02855 [Bordetella sp. 02P26C-1]|nr:Hint domain-containing protein [Bordetella sp. 02P26C-1]MVW77859.1 hypothetical protein [Bordetella sp. 02P26C-1]